ncbi:hypothetical protein JN11_04340 [Mucilaginibacter frigoritolerans]|uniref:WG repeat protein n=1 Tax=Mucilaginibacter frigoritolerans TaxID=652788 RepID=A0A562TPT1_9SPHI|nr:hypothetical protein [Mucilaginibacter frigoritolerans]TWI95601.1 hypothetical protein JN11_04340 [Mucilaginibacter frigoritolerans]
MNNFKINALKLFIIILMCILNSCDTFDSHKHLIGRYYFNHTKFGKCICYKVDDNDDYVELIDGAFSLIGFDSNYIIVERNKDQFFIVPIYKEMNYSPEKGIVGPLNPKEFNEKKKMLKINADFSMNTN